MMLNTEDPRYTLPAAPVVAPVAAALAAIVTAALAAAAASPTCAGPPSPPKAQKRASGPLPTPTPTPTPGPTSQCTLAAKTSWPTVPASDPAVRSALEAKEITKAVALVTREGGFTGTVASVYVAPNDRLIIVNFAKDYSKAVTAVMYPSAYPNFPDMRKLEKKRVLVTGQWKLYRGRPEIILRNAGQIRVVR